MGWLAFQCSDFFITADKDTEPKGLYQKARRGKIPNFTGIGSLYEAPLNPDVHVHTEHESIEEIVNKLLTELSFR